MATLIDLDTRRRYPVTDRVLIGRDATCDLRFDDPMISMKHAELVRTTDGGFEIRDLESRRGTFVGTQKVSTASVRHGDELLIGPVRLGFEDVCAPAAADDELIRLRAVVELGKAIGVEHDLGRLLERVLDTCFQLLRADRGAIVVYHPHSRAPAMTATRTRSAADAPLTPSTSVLSQVMLTHEPYLSTEVDSDAVLQRSESLMTHGVHSVMAVPLLYQAEHPEWLGVIQLDSRASETFHARDLELLAAIAGAAALAIKNVMLVQQVQTVTNDEWRRLDRIIGSLPLGVIVLDERHRCVLANEWATSREPLLGAIRAGHDLVTIGGIACDQILASQQLETTVGNGRTLSLTGTTMAGGHEAVIVLQDVTDERERLGQAAHRDRVALLGQLAGGIAHDFNNLLVVILNYANLLGEMLEDPEQRDDARMITQAATNAADLTRQLLMFSRRELVKPKVVDVASVVTTMEKLLQRTLGAEIELVTSIGPNVPRILIQPSQVEQILINLVVNARDAMPGGGRVTLSVSTVDVGSERAPRSLAPGRYVVIDVLDTGAGMSADVMSRVFEPYFTTKARGQGTGLGLATVHGIVQQAHGDITVTSTPGKGSRFRIWLPATTQATDLTAPHAVLNTERAVILVVDDDENVRRLTERLLRGAGYDVLCAASGEAALALARTHAGNIDLLLTDMVMPGMSGRDVARQLHSEQPTVEVLFMSGYHVDAAVSGSQLVMKPFDRPTLLGKVSEVIARSSAP